MGGINNPHVMKKYIIISVLAAMFVSLFAACSGGDLQGSLRNVPKAVDDEISFDMEVSVDEDGILTGMVMNKSVAAVRRLRLEITVDGVVFQTDQGETNYDYEGGDEMGFRSIESLTPGVHQVQMCLKNADGKSLKCTVETLSLMEDETFEED